MILPILPDYMNAHVGNVKKSSFQLHSIFIAPTATGWFVLGLAYAPIGTEIPSQGGYNVPFLPSRTLSPSMSLLSR